MNDARDRHPTNSKVSKNPKMEKSPEITKIVLKSNLFIYARICISELVVSVLIKIVPGLQNPHSHVEINWTLKDFDKALLEN